MPSPLVPLILDQLPTEHCVPFPGAVDHHGYARVRVNGAKVMAHRHIYELVVGPIGDGLTIDHTCGNRGCMNPAHMEPVTLRTNILRGGAVSAINARKDTCDAGHTFDYTNARGERVCRTCRAERHARWWAARH